MDWQLPWQLRDAAMQGDLPTLLRILQQPAGGGFIVNAGDPHGWTALHYAVCRGRLAIVQAILQVEGVNVNARKVGGFTPLHFAACSVYTELDRLPIIQALLDAGADPNAADDAGDTPLFFAAFSKNKNVVKILLDGGANSAAQNNDRDTPLHAACCVVGVGRLDIAKSLIWGGHECLTMRNNFERTPLDQANELLTAGKRAPIQKYILMFFAAMIAQRDGLLCLHSVLQEATFIHGNEEGGNEGGFRLAVGTLNTKSLHNLLEYLIAAVPGSVSALDRDCCFPLQVACRRNFPDCVLHILLRSYPDALLW